MRYSTLILALILTIGCDSGNGNGGNDTVTGDVTDDLTLPPEDGSGDTTPPEFRDVRVEIHAAPSIPLDLNNQDVERVLPMSFPATFTVFTTDDESTADAIAATILQGDDETPVDGQEAEFANGLWTIDVPSMGPGQTFRVRVEDEAGNADVWVYALSIPTLDEAVVGDWDTRWYDAEGAHMHSWEATWDADGTWEESRAEPDLLLDGAWAIAGDLLTVEILTADPGDLDPETVDWKEESTFYVDETYLSTGPLVREDGDTGLEGIWTRAVKQWRHDGDDLILKEDVTHTVTLAEGGALSVTVAGTINGESDQEQLMEGTWVLVPNENYIENYGDYLVLTIDTIDGAPLAEADTWVDLMVIRHDLLLLSPKVRAF